MFTKPESIIKELHLPDFQSRNEMLYLLSEFEYGHLPPKPSRTVWKTEKNIIPNFCAGKATLDKITAVCTINNKSFSFPFYVAVPAVKNSNPFFIHINFRNNIPDRYMPTEELIDNGFAVLSFCYGDITADNNDFTSGLAGILYENGKREPNGAGKIAMWAWAAQRVMDYAESVPDIFDTERSAVCGHSRLGKTALLAAAADKRFKFCYSNDSGCSGAALSRGKSGETVADICRSFPYWFCENYTAYAENENAMLFDQHFLLASIYPRYVCIGSAKEDLWADPVYEMLCCVAAGDYYIKNGKDGFAYNHTMPKAGDKFLNGSIGYHMREGKHYFSRDDWHIFIEFIKNKTI